MSTAEKVRVTFEADTMDDLVRKCKAFINRQQASLTAPAHGCVAPNTWAVPAWSPNGSRWKPRLTFPMLIGPDGKEVPVTWVAGTPQKPKVARQVR